MSYFGLAYAALVLLGDDRWLTALMKNYKPAGLRLVVLQVAILLQVVVLLRAAVLFLRP
jgi:hypothetical protein